MQPDSNGDVAVAPPAPDADAETTAFLDRYLPVPPPDDIPMQGPHIASDSDLERFAALPASQRCLTDTLKGVLLETALTGVVRYNWSLIRPLAESLMEKTLRDYDAAAMDQGAAGPSQPAFQNESLDDTIERFKSYMGRFEQAPWTLQRLCEVLLAPRNQYAKLHKVGVTTELPPLPRVTDFTRPVNINPPPVYTLGNDGPAPLIDSAADAASAAFTHSLIGPVTTHSNNTSTHIANAAALTQQNAAAGSGVAGGQAGAHHHAAHHHAVANAPGSHGQGSPGAGITPQEHMEEDHWPENVGPRPGISVGPHTHAQTHGALGPLHHGVPHTQPFAAHGAHAHTHVGVPTQMPHQGQQAAGGGGGGEGDGSPRGAAAAAAAGAEPRSPPPLQPASPLPKVPSPHTQQHHAHTPTNASPTTTATHTANTGAATSAQTAPTAITMPATASGPAPASLPAASGDSTETGIVTENENGPAPMDAEDAVGVAVTAAVAAAAAGAAAAAAGGGEKGGGVGGGDAGGEMGMVGVEGAGGVAAQQADVPMAVDNP